MVMFPGRPTPSSVVVRATDSPPTKKLPHDFSTSGDLGTLTSRKLWAVAGVTAARLVASNPPAKTERFQILETLSLGDMNVLYRICLSPIVMQLIS
jgi:hypothetical protein